MRTTDGYEVDLSTIDLGTSGERYILQVVGTIKVGEDIVLEPELVEDLDLLAEAIQIMKQTVRERIEWLLDRDAGSRATLQGPTN